ncbi:MAG: hypothetical protein EPN93_09635 [Spirochaetes bacterium]|nr:MAG: hypothetical protein EPN93_09635 [Spirochaetota bacterium]
MEERYRLFDATLASLNEAGALSSLILVGSWCQHLYRFAFGDPEEIPALITSDIDFLIPHHGQITRDINISELLESLGFALVISPVEHFTKYIRRELEVEFLVSETGRGRDKPHDIKKLHINAQGLRYLLMLQENTETLPYKTIPVRLAAAEAYVLHKFLISGKRAKPEKREKDLAAAVQLGEYLVRLEDRAMNMKKILASIHPRWRRDILKTIGEQSVQLYKILNI